MSAAALLRELRAAGVILTATGGRLHVEARPGTITAELRARLAAAKPAILEALAQQADPEAIRVHLLELAEADLIPASIVHALPDADVIACEGETDATLTAYLCALVAAQDMDAGLIPTDWGEAVAGFCEGCGPVWLWPGAPARVLACPWCFRRKAGKRIPRPKMRCRDCKHYTPDPLNPQAGIGTCAAGRWARWPMQSHHCDAWRPGGVQSLDGFGGTPRRVPSLVPVTQIPTP